ncbi:hypothetical protein BIFGAL_04371 [Bifidobacterium gallicum DSM 20093 = LMG 11596]|uniref:Uncharacterized protein n=1 Tax=Bifidobacterium gallicum DSM 20093 = LMG 11596 TaxID=561180 RepID=D1NWW4_9BIFI|nr:hypothetical protein BIFGAL_04371 [Bifidobacterium gallicum DSM 20093 = LMG 11596]
MPLMPNSCPNCSFPDQAGKRSYVFEPETASFLTKLVRGETFPSPRSHFS